MEKFWAKVNKDGECWEWTGAADYDGYGQLKIKGKMHTAHRMSWELANGPIPRGEGPHGTCVLHKCDNPSCVNPAHLFLGTHQDNVTDKVTKGRQSHTRGSAHGNSKLSESQVSAIRYSFSTGVSTLKELAEMYPVSLRQIGRITSGENRTSTPCLTIKRL